jgi:hypothetical protein
MMGLGEAADIRWWYEFLTEECDMIIGQRLALGLAGQRLGSGVH